MKVVEANDLYNEKSVLVEVTDNGHSTNVAVWWLDDMNNRHYQEWDGEFGENDFVEEFGFKLVK